MKKIATVEELRSALEEAKTAEQAQAVLNSATVKILREYAKEEGYYMPNFTNARKAEMVNMLSPTFDEDEADEAEALTLEKLEYETGFTYCRRLGEEFLSGELSLEQISNQIESLEKSMKYGDNKGSIYGLAYAFGITLEGKSYEELLSEIKEFERTKAEKSERIHTQREIRKFLEDAETPEDYLKVFERCELKTVREYAVNALSGWNSEDLKKLTRSEIAELIFSDEPSPREKARSEARQEYLAGIAAKLKTAERDTVLTELVAEAEDEIFSGGTLHELVRYLGLREKYERYCKETPEPEATPGDTRGSLGRLAARNNEVAVRVIKEALTAEELPEISKESYEQAREEYRTADKVYREVSSEYYKLQAEKNKLFEEWQGLIEAIRVMEQQKHQHLAGLSMLKDEVHEKYFEVRLKSFQFYIKKIRACKDYDRKAAVYSEVLKKFKEHSISEAI